MPYEPLLRTEPLIIDPVDKDDWQRLSDFLPQHGGTITTTPEGRCQVMLPGGTTEVLNGKNDTIEIYTLTFPDQAIMLWYRKGDLSEPPRALAEVGTVIPIHQPEKQQRK
jgi:hypothetical protein